MILSTLVTKNKNKRLQKTLVGYSILTIFFLVFSRIYESFSFGETSLHMHYLFVVPLVGGIILALLLKIIPNLGRISLNLWNSSVASSCSNNWYAFSRNRQSIRSFNDSRSTLLVCWYSFCYLSYSITFLSEEKQ